MRSRSLAALLALSGLVLPLLGALHAASTRHVPCAEHGDLLEGDAESPATVHQHQAGSAQFEPGEPAAPHSHEHCALLLQARQSAVWTEPGLLAAPRPAIAESSLDRAWPARAAIALLLLAPKASPPRAC